MSIFVGADTDDPLLLLQGGQAAFNGSFGYPRPGHYIRRCCPVGFGNEGEDGREVIVFDFSATYTATYTATIRKRRVQSERIIRNPHDEEAVGELEGLRAIGLDDVLIALSGLNYRS